MGYFWGRGKVICVKRDCFETPWLWEKGRVQMRIMGMSLLGVKRYNNGIVQKHYFRVSQLRKEPVLVKLLGSKSVLRFQFCTPED